MRILPFLVLVAALTACGARTEAPKPEAAAAAPEKKLSREEAAEAEKLTALAAKKPEFEAALAAKDETRIDDLADAGNGWALHHRAQERLSSQDFSQQQGGFEDMEAAASLGVAEAQLWVGTRMAYGLEGYPWKPSSGLIMMKKAASQDNIDAILAVGLIYEQDGLMQDLTQAKIWYERGAELGSDKAKDALAKLGAPKDF
jgi:hypothetical protein